MMGGGRVTPSLTLASSRLQLYNWQRAEPVSYHGLFINHAHSALPLHDLLLSAAPCWHDMTHLQTSPQNDDYMHFLYTECCFCPEKSKTHASLRRQLHWHPVEPVKFSPCPPPALSLSLGPNQTRAGWKPSSKWLQWRRHDKSDL